jgi:hypothetical protein
MNCVVQTVCAAAVQPVSAARFTLALAGSARGWAPKLSLYTAQDRGLPQASLADVVVQPAQRPAASLMGTRDVILGALSRISTLSIIYHTHTPDGRGHCGDRPRAEQPNLCLNSTIGTVRLPSDYRGLMIPCRPSPLGRPDAHPAH